VRRFLSFEHCVRACVSGCVSAAEWVAGGSAESTRQAPQAGIAPQVPGSAEEGESMSATTSSLVAVGGGGGGLFGIK